MTILTYVLNIIRLAIQELLVRPILIRTPQYNKKYKISVCGIFKDEGPFLKEWIEFNRMVGVDHFYLYNNNSTDNFLDVLAPYIESGLVTYVNFPYDHAQIKAYKHFCDTYKNETQWVSFLDIDEFFVPLSHSNLKDWIKTYEKYPVIQIYWKMFGTSGLMKHNWEQFVIEQYHTCWSSLYDCGKCLINTDYEFVRYDASMHHGPTMYYPFMGLNVKVKPVNVFKRSALGEGTYFKIWNNRRSPSIQINHYWSKAWDIYNAKRKRTDVFFKDNPKANLDYFLFHENQNCTQDYNIYKFLMQFKLRINNID